MSVALTKTVSYGPEGEESEILLTARLNSGTKQLNDNTTVYTHTLETKIDDDVFSTLTGLTDGDLATQAVVKEAEAKRKVDLDNPDNQPMVAELQDLGFELPEE